MVNRLRQVGRAALGGAVTAVIGTYLVPVVNQLLVFIPQTQLLVNGLTPHVVIAYGVAYALADYVNERFVKM